MARDRTRRARARLLQAAADLVGVERCALIICRRILDVLEPEAESARPADTSAELSTYDMAIVSALSDKPLSAEQLARRAGHRCNSWFRARLGNLVEKGQIRRTRRGYRSPG